MATYPDPADRAVLAGECRRCPDLIEDWCRIAWGVGPNDDVPVQVPAT